MIQTELVCPQCGSRQQEKLNRNRYVCAHCHTEWTVELPEEEAKPETPETQEEAVMVVKPASIRVGEFLHSKGYLTGLLHPMGGLGNWPYIDFFRKRPPVPVKTLFGLGKTTYQEQPPRHIGQLQFNRYKNPNHWLLEYHGESKTEEITAIAHELADKFGVRIYAILESK